MMFEYTKCKSCAFIHSSEELTGYCSCNCHSRPGGTFTT